MTDFEIARSNMVETQIRPNGVTDPRIIVAMAEVPRERFVPQERDSLAYMDEDIPVATAADGSRRVLIEPMALARLLQLAAVKRNDLILDVGCATGYSTALLARLGQSVIGIEADPELAERAGQTLADLGVDNAAVVNAAHGEGYASDAPYDVIMIAGRVAQVPPALTGQLKPGGRLVCVLGTEATAKAVVMTRAGDGTVATRHGFDATVAAMPGFPVPEPGFVF